MKVVGRTTIGAVLTDRAADRKLVERWTMPACRVVKLTAYLDGLGSGAGVQAGKPVIYTSAGVLVATGDEVAIKDGQAPSWVDFTFSAYKGGVTLAAGDYDLGFIFGSNTNTVRAYSDPVGGASQRHSNVDTYADGAASTFGAPDVTDNQLFSWFATYVSAWTPPSDDLYDLAQLPFEQAQKAFEALSNPKPVTRQIANLGWHGNALDDGQASFVVVDPDGPLSDLVGTVVRIINDSDFEARSVWAFCHTAKSLDPGDDLSLPRALFLALSPLNAESVPVTVQVIV